MPAITNLLVTLQGDSVPESAHKIMLEKAVPDANVTYCLLKDLTDEMIETADVWLGNPSVSILNRAKKLKLLQLCTAGADYYFSQPENLPEELAITTASGAFGLSIAEYMLGSILMLMRHFHLYRDNQHEQLWQRRGNARSIHGSTVLIVGLGDLGTEFAWRMKALGATVIGLRRTDARKPDCVDELYLTDQLDTVLPRADVVALCLPANSETKGLFDQRRLGLMKDDAYLLNVGRGSAVDSDALCEALRSKHLAGAVLDVTDPEPLPKDHPLWKEPNAVLTPHISGFYDLPYTLNRVMEITVDNLRRYTVGEPLVNLVDPQTGYRRLL